MVNNKQIREDVSNMPLPPLTNLACTHCRRKGLRFENECGCWEKCPCGRSKVKNRKCSNSKCFADVVADIKESYWTVDENSGRAHKTRSWSKEFIQKQIAVTGNHFKSLKDARAAAKLDPSEWLAFRVKLYGEPTRSSE